MAKKKMSEENFHIKHEELLDFKSCAHAHEVAKLKLEKIEKDHQMMLKDIEIAQLKAQAFASKELSLFRKKLGDTKNAYDLVKKKIEDRIGYSLNDRVIDELTLEIKKI